MVDLEKCSLDAPKNVRYSFQRGSLASGHSILVFKLTGRASNSGEFEDVYTYAPAWILAGLEAWQPAGIVLDFRELEYEYGDLMTNIVAAPEFWYACARAGREIGYLISSGRSAPEEFPVAIVASKLCKVGLTSLLSEVMQKNPEECLHDTLDDAWAALERKLDGWKPY